MELRNDPVLVNQVREIQHFKIIRRSPQRPHGGSGFVPLPPGSCSPQKWLGPDYALV